MSTISQFQSSNIGLDMVTQIFTIINKMIQSIESTFYNGIINNPSFKQAVNAAFLLYIAVYGVMIAFNLAPFRTGEVMNRLIKLAIVYTLCMPGGWTFFALWIQQPVIGGINNLITDLASAASVSGSGTCVSAGQFGSSAIAMQSSGGGTALSLAMGPMAMLYGPMTCVFAAKFMTAIDGLLLTGFYGWLLALMLLWAMVEFALMMLGAIATYVKAIVGLTFLFGLAPIFFAFYLFEKSRSLTEGWINMVVGFALQPVILFAFLAFYATIIGTVVSTMFTDDQGNSTDMCYVPFYNMPGMFSMYWWRFTHKFQTPGGDWRVGNTSGGQWFAASGALGTPLPSPVKILNIMYFMVLASLGKNFSQHIENLSMLIAGGKGGGAVSGDQVAGYLKSHLGLGGDRGVGGAATDAYKGVSKSASKMAAGGAKGAGNSGGADASKLVTPRK